MLKKIDSNVINGYSDFVSHIAEFSCSKVIVEIGVEFGYTTSPLCRVARANKGRVFGYDIFEPVGEYHNPKTKEDVKSHLYSEGYTDSEFKITKIDTKSDEFETVLVEDTGGVIDFAFIDGDHSYEGTINDFKKVYNHLSEEGIMIFHDTYSHTGCRKFVLDLYEKYNDGTFDIINLPYGGGNRRYGLTILAKRSYPLYPSGIWYDGHENHSKTKITNEEVYSQELDWYTKQKQKNENNFFGH